MFSFCLIWCLGYLILLFWLSQKWPKSGFFGYESTSSLSVTLLIPFRNELANARNLITSLSELPFQGLRILLIDDHSEDGSFGLFQSLIKNSPHIQLLQSPGIGKKEALNFGISQADSELILTSDADCKFAPNWVNLMKAPFSDPKTQLVAGPVVSADSPRTLFTSFQQIEWCSILLITQIGFALHKPIMCSGANLAFRKSAFEEVKGYEGNSHFLSGDDEFLLKKIKKKFGSSSCTYLPFPEVLVITNAMDSWGSLIKQRIRWAGKWKLHRDWIHTFSAIFSLFSQLIWLGLGLVMWYSNWFLLVFPGVLFFKIFSEKMALGKVAKKMKLAVSWKAFIFTSLIHPFYVLIVGLGSLRGNVLWKGRKSFI